MTDNDNKRPAPKFGDTPAGYFLLIQDSPSEDSGVELSELAQSAFMEWRKICLGALVGAAFAALVAYFLPVRYQAVLVAVPTSQGVGREVSNLRNQVGGLASLVGLDIGGGDRSEETFATLVSNKLARDFIEERNLLPVFFPSLWDDKNKSWKASAESPSLSQGVKLFMRDILSVARDRKTGLVTVTVTWRSAPEASEWANDFIRFANERLRAEAIQNAERSVAYLKAEAEKTNVVELRNAIFRVIESQITSAMFANVSPEYAFRVIDRAFPPEERTGPGITQMSAAGLVAGGLITLVFLFLFRVIRPR